MSGKPRFFCEHCGFEVPRNAPKCPGCGRFFSSVKCPKCDFIGSAHLFSAGCPSCGYSAPSDEHRFPQYAPGKPLEASPALPLWVYALTVLALIGVLFALFWALSS